MARRHERRFFRWNRTTRAAGILPLVVAITSAVGLTGAAFYTVNQASCADPAQYIRHDNHVELVGGCVDSSELPTTLRGPAPQDGVERGNYGP
jgi:hypothetical protein